MPVPDGKCNVFLLLACLLWFIIQYGLFMYIFHFPFFSFSFSPLSFEFTFFSFVHFAFCIYSGYNNYLVFPYSSTVRDQKMVNSVRFGSVRLLRSSRERECQRGPSGGWGYGREMSIAFFIPVRFLYLLYCCLLLLSLYLGRGWYLLVVVYHL